MKILAKLKSNKNGILSFETTCNLPLKIENLYTLSINTYKSNRSLEQNSLLWGIIQQISDETGNDPMDVYVDALENANVKYEWIGALADAENSLKTIYRAVKTYGTFLTDKNVELVRYKCYLGSSKFNSKEMTSLIDYLLCVANELGIYIEVNYGL